MSYTNQVINDLLQPFSTVIGEDLEKYRNHVLRVFQNCLLLDSNKDNHSKYAIAAVYHDIGIWTNQTIDYLVPSIEQAKIFLTQTGNEEWIEEICLMIYWHHKFSRYEGRYVETVENFRKADWIDVSLALRTFKFDKKKINENRSRFPNSGFHLFLIKETVKNLFRNPLNPLPIFKK